MRELLLQGLDLVLEGLFSFLLGCFHALPLRFQALRLRSCCVRRCSCVCCLQPLLQLADVLLVACLAKEQREQARAGLWRSSWLLAPTWRLWRCCSMAWKLPLASRCCFSSSSCRRWTLSSSSRLILDAGVSAAGAGLGAGPAGAFLLLSCRSSSLT